MPVGTVAYEVPIVKTICANKTPDKAYDTLSVNDSLEGLESLIKYIIAKKRLEINPFSACAGARGGS